MGADIAPRRAGLNVSMQVVPVYWEVQAQVSQHAVDGQGQGGQRQLGERRQNAGEKVGTHGPKETGARESQQCSAPCVLTQDHPPWSCSLWPPLK